MKTTSIIVELTPEQLAELEPIRAKIEEIYYEQNNEKVLTMGYIHFHNVPNALHSDSFLRVALFREPESNYLRDVIEKHKNEIVKL